MPKIKNKLYKKFLKENYLDTNLLDETELVKGLNRITGQYIKESRAFIILLYYSGARPNELLRLKGEDINLSEITNKETQEKTQYLNVKIPSSKKGITRKLLFKLEKPLIKEVSEYAIGLFPNLLIFYHLMSKQRRLYKNKKGEVKEYYVITNKLYYNFKKWFPDLTLYYFRHNRFCRNIEAGATVEQIRQMKGAKTVASVFPYSHQSKRSRVYLAEITD